MFSFDHYHVISSGPRDVIVHAPFNDSNTSSSGDEIDVDDDNNAEDHPPAGGNNADFIDLGFTTNY